MVLGLLFLFTIAVAAQALEPLWVYKSYASEGYSVSISSDGSSIAAALDKIYIFNGKGEKLWSGYGGEKVVITDDGSYIAAGTYSGIVYLDRTGKTLWEDSEWHPVDEISMQGEGRYIGAIGGSAISLYNNAGILLGRNTALAATALAVSPDGSMLAIGTPLSIKGLNKGCNEIWSYETLENRQILYSYDGSFVAAASGYTVLVFDPGGNLLWKYRTRNSLADLAISSDDAYIVAGSRDKKVYLFGRKGELIWSREIGDPVSSVAISDDGSFIAAGSTSGLDKGLYLFNTKGDLVGTYKMEAWVMDVSLSLDGSYLAAVSNDGNLYYFRTEPPASTTTLTTTTVTTLATPVMTTMATQSAPTTTAPPTIVQTAIAPEPAIGILRVDSIPNGADVYVDHRYRGTTPLNIKDLAKGTHRIGLIRTGYVEWGSDVELSNEKIVSVSATLVPYPTTTKTGFQPFTMVFAICIAIVVFYRWRVR